MQIITRKEAKEKGLTHYFTGKPCKHGHVSKRITLTGYCDECRKIKWQQNRDKHLSNSKRWKQQNPDKVKKHQETQNERRRSMAVPKPLSARQQAIANGEDKYIPEKPCVNGHITFRKINDRACPICKAERCREYKKNNQDKIRSWQKIYNEKNKERLLETRREYIANNKDKIKQTRKKWLDNGGRVKKCVAQNMRVKSIKRATLSTLTNKDFYDLYETCSRITQTTGIEYQVDHYYPIRGKTICGLNVPWNLQIITAEENKAKNNKMPEEFYGPNHTMIQMPAYTK